MIVDYECPQCLYTFESPRGVVRHMEKVHGSKPKRQMDYGGIDYLCEGKKKFPCEYCHKDFASKQKVKQHINEMTCLTSKKAPRKERNLNEELKGVQESATEALATGPNDAGEALLSITACHEKGQLSAQEALKMVSAVCRGDEIILDDINKGIEFVYGKPEDWLGSFAKNNAIICLTNSNTFEVNTLILATLRKQPQKTIKSLTKLNKEPKNKEDAIKMMNVISPSLLVKGIPLFCNKNTKDGLVNGTRFTYDAMMTGERGGQRLCVSELDSAKNKSYSVAIGKGNYPFDWGFSITVHKAQGRTFDRVCLVLLEDAPFVHGQLTVALTRVRSMKDLRVVTKSKKCENVVDNAIREVAENIRKQAINK
jgi:hypothetical protein